MNRVELNRDCAVNVADLRLPTVIVDKVNAIVDALMNEFFHNIYKIILFGSYATNKWQPDSDIDLAVVLNELPEMKDRIKYKLAVDIEDADMLFCAKEQLDGDGPVFKRIKEHGILLYEQL